MILKPQDKQAIVDFINNKTGPFYTGERSIEELYELIQKNGIRITSSNNKKLEGLMCLQFSETDYIAIKHTPFKKGSFFPCMLQSYSFSF